MGAQSSCQAGMMAVHGMGRLHIGKHHRGYTARTGFVALAATHTGA